MDDDGALSATRLAGKPATSGSSGAGSHGRATPERLAEAIVGLRRERPTWGPRKIVDKLSKRRPEADWPSPSTAGEILKRAGLAWRIDRSAIRQPRLERRPQGVGSP